MFAIMKKWCGAWKRRRTPIGSGYSRFHLVSSVIPLVLISVALAQDKSGNVPLESSEYYYDNDLGNGTSEFPKLNNASLGSDEYYYYVEEVIVRPKNGTGERLLSSKVIQRYPGKNGGYLRGNKEDTFKSENVHGIGFQNVYDDIPEVPPSPEPLKELVTLYDPVGPAYTDRNYGAYGVSGNYEDVPLGEPLGPSFGEVISGLPISPFDLGQGDAELLRPPPPPPTEPPEDARPEVQFGEGKDVEYIDGIVPGGGAQYGESGEGYDPQNPIPPLQHDEEEPNKIKINTELTLDAFGWAPAKNPIVLAKLYLAETLAGLLGTSKTDVILLVEKFFNVVAELSVPKEHYLRVISFVGIYLFISVLTYGSENLAQIQCSVESKNKPIKNWKYHVGRRFVPARSTFLTDHITTVDPHLQEKFLDLFRGVDEDDENSDEFADISKTISSSEEDLADELDHISELCPMNAFYYSLNPRHIEAYTSLKRVFLAQNSLAEVLSLAKYLLVKEKVHPKVWYFAIIGASLGRTDMTGFSVAHPLDAIPDWYIPADLISDRLRAYRRGRSRVKRYTVTHTHSRNTTIIRNKPYKYYYYKKKMKGGSKKEDKPKQTKAPSDKGQTSTAIFATNKTNYTVTVMTGSKNTSVSNSNSTVKKKMSTTPAPLSSTLKTKATTSPSTTKAVPPHPPKNKTISATTTETPKKKPASIPQPQLSIGGSKGDKGVLPLHKTKKGNKLNQLQSSRPSLELDDDHRQKTKKGKKKKGKKGKRRRNKGCITIDWRVGIDNGIENELWYWREDLMLNQHHWYWHMTHHPNSTMHGDRRAELFFYMHRSLIARYNAERLSNGLPRVTPLHFRPGGVIYEGYNSHLADINSDVYWTPRWPQTPLSDVFHLHDPDFAYNITLGGYLRSYRRLVQGIRTGKLFSQYGNFAPIDHLRGIEPLANTVEASDLSVNPMYYDPMGIHALGHILIGLSSDPDYRFRRVTGVMSDAAVSMRDPSFYSYHLFMDNLFEMHKQQLAPYKPIGGDFPLLWRGVEVVKIELRSQRGVPYNELRTFWTHHKFELSPGVDRSTEKGEHEKICAQHLDHEPFHFKIVVDRKPCVKSKSGKATIRIFMAPRYDEKGKRIPVKIQRRLMFQLDSFPVKLKVGRNTITRYAEDSSLTQPWTKSIRELERGPDSSGSADFCGCGWPQHLYISKGNPAGMAFDLFVMVTNYDEDYVPNDPKLLEIPETCNSPYIFCGLPRRLYPDRRPMGYPFDRPLFRSLNCPPGWTFFSLVCRSLSAIIFKPFDTLEQYVSRVPNMAMLKFHIKHLDIFLPEPARH